MPSWSTTRNMTWSQSRELQALYPQAIRQFKQLRKASEFRWGAMSQPIFLTANGLMTKETLTWHQADQEKCRDAARWILWGKVTTCHYHVKLLLPRTTTQSVTECSRNHFRVIRVVVGHAQVFRQRGSCHQSMKSCNLQEMAKRIWKPRFEHSSVESA